MEREGAAMLLFLLYTLLQQVFQHVGGVDDLRGDSVGILETSAWPMAVWVEANIKGVKSGALFYY